MSEILSDTVIFSLGHETNIFFNSSLHISKGKVKVKWSRYRPGVAQRVGRGIALLFHDRGTGK